MQKSFLKLLLAAMAVSVWCGTAMAADHIDSPGAVADPAADINDVYVFSSQATDAANTRRTVFVMTVVPLADENSRLSPDVEYRFWVRDRVSMERKDIVCTATLGPEQMMTCTGPGGATDTVAFNAVEPGDGLADNMRTFVGLRDDPFFFDLAAFQAVVADPTEVGQLVDNTGTDFFAPLNVVAIVVDVKNEVFGDSTILEVYGVTTRNGLN